jgi:hypothetical protein
MRKSPSEIDFRTWASRSRSAQGLDPTIHDAVTLARVAALISAQQRRLMRR